MLCFFAIGATICLISSTEYTKAATPPFNHIISVPKGKVHKNLRKAVFGSLFKNIGGNIVHSVGDHALAVLFGVHGPYVDLLPKGVNAFDGLGSQ